MDFIFILIGLVVLVIAIWWTVQYLRRHPAWPIRVNVGRSAYNLIFPRDKTRGKYPRERSEYKTLIFPKGGKYTGECNKKDKPHGQGTYVWGSGGKYIGNWKDGKQDGHGAFEAADAQTYTGGWRNGKKHGPGTMTGPHGSRYIGEFKNNKQHGKGTTIIATGVSYTGQHKNGEWHGWGTLNLPRGEKFTGHFLEGKPRGQGTMVHSDGTVEEDVWQDDIDWMEKKNS